MSPDISSDTSSLPSTFLGIDMSPMHLLWSTALTLIIAHFCAKYLATVTPRGYGFWFTIVSLILGFVFM